MAAKVDQIYITDGWLIVKKKGVKRYFSYKNEKKQLRSSSLSTMNEYLDKYLMSLEKN
jgi:hypothetical protein